MAPPYTGPVLPAPKPVALMAVKRKALRVARIFDVLGILTLTLGGLAIAGMLLSFLGSDSNGIGVAVIAAVAAGTALTWASISVFTIVAGYIAQKAEF